MVDEMTRRLAVMQKRLDTRDAELATALLEKGMLETELRAAERATGVAHRELQREEGARQIERAEAAVHRAAVIIELGIQEVQQADTQQQAAHAAREAAVQRAAVTTELEEQEDAARAEADRSHQRALAADAERELLGAELGATERSLEREQRRRRTAIAVAAAAASSPANGQDAPAVSQPGIPVVVGATGTSSSSIERSMGDGVTNVEASTGPSGHQDNPPLL